jgi:hypothetical protein
MFVSYFYTKVQNENTKDMPNMKELEMSPIEGKAYTRFQTAKKNAELLMCFFEKGFKTYPAIKAIVQHYYPLVSDKRISNFWNMVGVDASLQSVIENVLEKLKAE